MTKPTKRSAIAASKRCSPRIVQDKSGARRCDTCGARAATTKTIMLCQRTGGLPGQ